MLSNRAAPPGAPWRVAWAADGVDAAPLPTQDLLMAVGQGIRVERYHIWCSLKTLLCEKVRAGDGWLLRLAVIAFFHAALDSSMPDRPDCVNLNQAAEVNQLLLHEVRFYSSLAERGLLAVPESSSLSIQ